MGPERLTECLRRLPAPEELRAQLVRNIEENRLLRKLLKLSEQRQRVEQAKASGEKGQ